MRAVAWPSLASRVTTTSGATGRSRGVENVERLPFGLLDVAGRVGGGGEQVVATLDGVKQGAAGRVSTLEEMIAATPDTEEDEFAGRRHVTALALRFQLDFEQLLVDWSRWAREQTGTWPTVSDPGSWDWRQAVAPGDG